MLRGLSKMLTILVVTALCGVALAQPGPYSLWAAPTSTRMSTPTVYGERVYAMPFFYEGGNIPFEVSAWNSSTGASLFTVPVSAWSNNTQDYKGLAPGVTRVSSTARHNAGRLVVVYAFHQSSSLKAVDGETGEFLWEQSLYTATCQSILHCEFVGLSSPSEGIFIIEQPSNLTRLDASTGAIVWTAMLTDNDGNPGSTRSHIAADGDALIWSCRDRVHRVDLATGGFLWSSTIVLPNCSSPLDGCYVTDFTPPVVDGKYIVVGGDADYWGIGAQSPGVILSLWALTGTLRWFATPAYAMVSVAAGGGVAVANPGQYGGTGPPPNATFSVYNIETGEHLWSVNASSNYFSMSAVVASPSGNVAVGVTPRSGVFSQTLYVYHAQTGAVLGSIASSITNLPFISIPGQDTILVSDNDNAYGLTSIYIGNG